MAEKKDIRVQYYINFNSLMIKDCPSNLKQQQCYLRFVRGQNDLQTKKSVIDDGGYCEFNEKIEMKTQIEYDDSTGGYKPKKAVLHAVLYDGTNIGQTDLDLAEFATPNKYNKNLPLGNTAPGISKQSFIIVEIRTFDTAKPKEGTKAAGKPIPRGSVLVQPSFQTNQELNILQAKVE